MSEWIEWEHDKPFGLRGNWWLQFGDGKVVATEASPDYKFCNVVRYCKAEPPPLPEKKEEKPIECWCCLDKDGNQLRLFVNLDSAVNYTYKVGGRVAHLIEAEPLEKKIEELNAELEIKNKSDHYYAAWLKAGRTIERLDGEIEQKNKRIAELEKEAEHYRLAYDALSSRFFSLKEELKSRVKVKVNYQRMRIKAWWSVGSAFNTEGETLPTIFGQRKWLAELEPEDAE